MCAAIIVCLCEQASVCVQACVCAGIIVCVCRHQQLCVQASMCARRHLSVCVCVCECVCVGGSAGKQRYDPRECVPHADISE